MIRIRTGTSWLDDPRLAAPLRRAMAEAEGGVAQALIDALAIEVDGVDLAAGRAEVPLLPSLEGLLRAIARLLAGAAHAGVRLGDGEVELLLRRREESVLLTVVAPGPPSEVLASDVEVELEALCAAALEAAAELCADLMARLPGAAHGAHRLEVAARSLARRRPAPGEKPEVEAPASPPRSRRPRTAGCAVELAGDDAALRAYAGGRPDLGSLLVAGRVLILGPGGEELLALSGFPFLLLRDLTAAAGRALQALRRGEPGASLRLPAPGRAPGARLELDPSARTVQLGGRLLALAPLPLLRSLCEASLDLARAVRARNPRQAENAFVAALEDSAAERIAELDELEAGDLSHAGIAPARLPVAPRASPARLGPGRLRRLAFRRSAALDVGSPAGAGLIMGMGRGSGRRSVIAAGRDATVCLELSTGARRWAGPGATAAHPVPGGILLAEPDRLAVLQSASGRPRWSRPWSGAPATGVAALAPGPLAVTAPGTVTGLDPRTGATLWRFTTPGAARTWAVAFGGILVVGSDAGLLYGVGPEGRLLWRVRAPGGLTRPPVGGAGACLALTEAAGNAVLLAVDPASGARRFETPLELTPTAAPIPWGRRLALPGTVGGDPAVTVLERTGAPAWTAAPALRGAPAAVAAGARLVVRDAAGALVCLLGDGAVAWSRPGLAGAAFLPTHPPPAASRGAVVSAADDVVCVSLGTGELLAALPGVHAARLAVTSDLAIAALDATGLLGVYRLRTHLSVV
jgi:outer membrane protein assembly factor BamB